MNLTEAITLSYHTGTLVTNEALLLPEPIREPYYFFYDGGVLFRCIIATGGCYAVSDIIDTGFNDSGWIEYTGPKPKRVFMTVRYGSGLNNFYQKSCT